MSLPALDLYHCWRCSGFLLFEPGVVQGLKPMTPQEEYLLAGTRLDRASSRAAALRHAAERDQLAAEAEFLAAQSGLARFESSPGIPLPQYREVARDGDGD